jgi:hypothetical protein
MKRAAAILAALLSLALASSAGAAYDPLGAGTTKLVLDQRFARFLAGDGIEVRAAAGARRSGRVLTLPVSGGHLDPTVGRGEVEQEGTLVLVNSRKRVPLRKIVVKTTHSPLVAKVGGSQLKLASAGRIASRRSGFGTAFTAMELRLTAKVATRLNKKLRPPVPFEGGQPLGTLRSEAQPQLATILPSGRATLVLDGAFVAKLNERFVSVNPIFPAEHEGPTFTLPIIADGVLAPDGSQGTLRTGGDLEFLKLGSGQVFWHEPWLDLGAAQYTVEADVEPSPPYGGKGARAGIASILNPAASADPGARTVTVAGAQLVLGQQTAQTFNEVFAEPDGKAPPFAAGELLGTISFAAEAQ